jgi:hypothetical protein
MMSVREDVEFVDIVVRDRHGHETTHRYVPNYVSEVGTPKETYHYLNIVIDMKREDPNVSARARSR